MPEFVHHLMDALFRLFPYSRNRSKKGNHTFFGTLIVHLPFCKKGIEGVYQIKFPLTLLFQRGGLNAYWQCAANNNNN